MKYDCNYCGDPYEATVEEVMNMTKTRCDLCQRALDIRFNKEQKKEQQKWKKERTKLLKEI